MSPDYTYDDLNDEFDIGLEVGECPQPTGALPLAPGSPMPRLLHTSSPWDPRLVLDLAIGVDATEEILERYGLTPEAFDKLARVPSFRRELALAIREQREQGLSFAVKAKVQAESYLAEIDRMVYDDSIPASTRLEAIKSTVRWGRLEPEKEVKGDTNNATQVVVNISI